MFKILWLLLTKIANEIAILAKYLATDTIPHTYIHTLLAFRLASLKKRHRHQACTVSNGECLLLIIGETIPRLLKECLGSLNTTNTCWTGIRHKSSHIFPKEKFPTQKKWLPIASWWGGWQVPSRSPPIATFLQMPTKPIATSATTATHAGCVRRGPPFSRRGSVLGADDDRRARILQLNAEGLAASKINVIEQLAYKNKAFKAFVIVFRRPTAPMQTS